jgi:hypothetical protein
LALSERAVEAELFGAGIPSIERGQIEAADTLDFGCPDCFVDGAPLMVQINPGKPTRACPDLFNLGRLCCRSKAEGSAGSARRIGHGVFQVDIGFGKLLDFRVKIHIGLDVTFLNKVRHGFKP